MTAPYPPLRGKQLRKQEPKPHVPSDYDGSDIEESDGAQDEDN